MAEPGYSVAPAVWLVRPRQLTACPRTTMFHICTVNNLNAYCNPIIQSLAGRLLTAQKMNDEPACYLPARRSEQRLERAATKVSGVSYLDFYLSVTAYNQVSPKTR